MVTPGVVTHIWERSPGSEKLTRLLKHGGPDLMTWASGSQWTRECVPFESNLRDTTVCNSFITIWVFSLNLRENLKRMHGGLQLECWPQISHILLDDSFSVPRCSSAIQRPGAGGGFSSDGALHCSFPPPLRTQPS